jgi:hypothetical protein
VGVARGTGTVVRSTDRGVGCVVTLGTRSEYVLCGDGPYYLTFDKDYKLTGKEKQD